MPGGGWIDRAGAWYELYTKATISSSPALESQEDDREGVRKIAKEKGQMRNMLNMEENFLEKMDVLKFHPKCLVPERGKKINWYKE